jgi:hypothetical protein
LVYGRGSSKRKLHNGNFIIFPFTKYYQVDEIKENEMSRACSTHRYNNFFGGLEGKRPLGRAKHKWKKSIKVGVKRLWFEGLGWNQVV